MAYVPQLITTVSSLPVASAANKGQTAIVTDGITLTPITGLGLTPTGGGAIVLKVWSNGTAWLIG